MVSARVLCAGLARVLCAGLARVLCAGLDCQVLDWLFPALGAVQKARMALEFRHFRRLSDVEIYCDISLRINNIETKVKSI